MKKLHLLGTVCAVLFSFITASANASLVGRLALTPGGTDYQAAYDDVLNITWVTNAAISGLNNWDEQVAWADSLDYLGFDDWRLAAGVGVGVGRPADRHNDFRGGLFVCNGSGLPGQRTGLHVLPQYGWILW